MKRILAVALAVLFSLGMVACGGQQAAPSSSAPSQATASAEQAPAAQETRVVTDGLGRQVEVPWPIQRAVVANRYNSELIRACGAIDRVVGVDTCLLYTST